ncbi:Intracellular protein transport protein USO1 [Talaromyces islandicus]|uniref:Intracellular protein transport protein USO1 n=1 Tax=Talaromyces islandicus TaxID=28573 RepID=A0A0U1LIQ1_TALIS|nr:Intracellular protein transport protein USO1 [Talaromyces islandicus]
MQESIYGVIREVERIVTAPYAPSLNKLELIVEDVSQAVLHQWADCKPCQVSLLAAVILEQLPYSLKLLSRFGYVREFRNALLEREPMLLDQLLKHAIEGGEAEAEAEATMLSSSIPDDTSVPARIPLFLSKLLQKMVQEPCARTIRPLYEVVEGFIGNFNILKILPNDLMATFQLEATNILRSLNDPIASLLCLATFARIRRLWQPTENEAYMPTWLENIFQILGPKRAAKTLDLVFISAIMACSSSCSGYSPQERVFLVKLAVEICENFEEEIKRSWLGTNSPKVVKLCDKLRRADIDRDLQMMATFNTSEISNLLSYTVTGLQQSKDIAIPDIATTRVNLLALSAIKKSDAHLSAVRSYLERLPTADEETLKAYVQTFCSGQDGSICETFAVARHEAVPSKSYDFILPFLDRMKDQGKKPNGCPFAQATGPERLSGLCHKSTQRAVTVQTEGSSHEWRSKLATSLLENAQTSHQSIIQQMEAICRDFESRCASIEKPLAAVARERDELRRQLEEAREVNMELESQTLQSSEMISSLTSEKAQLAENNRDYSLQVEHLTEKVDVLQSELDSAREKSQEGLEMERTKARTRELDLMATVTERDDLLEEQQIEMDGMRQENTHLKERVDAISERNEEVSQERDALHAEVSKLQKEATQDRESLQNEISRLHQLMDIRESTNAEKDNRIMALTDINKDLSRELQSLKERIDQEKANAEALRSAAEEERQRHQSAVTEMERKHSAQTAQSLHEGQNKIDRYRNEITAIQNRAESKISKAEKELRTKDKRVQYLEKKVESLRIERSAKAREFSEAQEHITRLMNVMGFAKDQKSDNQKPATSIRGKEPRRSSRLADLQTQSFLPSEGETTMHTQFSVMQHPPTAANSFVQDSARRHSRHLTNADPLDHNRSFSPNKKESAIREREPLRQPLGDIDRNSPTKSQQGSQTLPSFDDEQNIQKTQSQAIFNVAEWGDVDLEFDDDDVFTSTGAR